MEATFNTGLNTYFGGKAAAGVVHQIINQLPRHDVFVSGFAGNCAVLRHKLPALYNVAIDLDPDVCDRWDTNDGLHVLETSFLDYLGDYPRRYFWDAAVAERLTTLFYLDPPYLGETRADGRPRYKCEAIDADWHRQLLELVVAKAAQHPGHALFCISCYDNPLYQAMLQPPTWRKIQFKARTRAYTATETLYMNYPAPTPEQLHDTRFLGQNFRHRERIKRRVGRFVRELNLMPAEDRFLVLRAVNEHFKN